jgi:hypothetical protein
MGRLRSIHERSSCCNPLPLSLDDWPGRPTSSQCLLLCPWLGSTGEAMTVGRARSASGFTVATLNFRADAPGATDEIRLIVINITAVLKRQLRTPVWTGVTRDTRPKPDGSPRKGCEIASTW